MKKAGYYGFGCFGIVWVIVGWYRIYEHQFDGFIFNPGTMLVMSFIAAVVAGRSYQLAQLAPSSGSTRRSVGSWLFGFGAAYLAFVMISILLLITYTWIIMGLGSAYSPAEWQVALLFLVAAGYGIFRLFRSR
jgi:hypothetical protein